MQRPYEIFTTECICPYGDPVQGFGLRAVGAARQGDLLCLYEGPCISKFHADMMTACNQGHSIKSQGALIRLGGVIDNTFLSLNWLSEFGAASLANCNQLVSSKRDRRGGRYTTMQTIPATAYFDHILLPKERKLPLPGNVWSNVVIALRASNVQDGQQYLASYGTGTTRAMFVPRAGKYINKRPKA